jgi:hypothetical protein
VDTSAQTIKGMHIWIDIRFVIGDEAALKSIYANKGASGLKPCLLCLNVFAKNTSRPIGFDGVHLLKHSDPCPEHFQVCTPTALGKIMAELRKPGLSKAARESLETAVGWSYIPEGFLEVARPLYPSESALWDYMHVIYANGVLNVHMGCLFDALRSSSVRHSNFHECLKEFKWPKAVPTAVSVFSEARVSKHVESGGFKGSASELLSTLPPLVWGLWRAVEYKPEVGDHYECLLCLYRIGGFLRAVCYEEVSEGALPCFTNLCKRYLTLFKLLYSEDHMIQKFHYSLAFQRVRLCSSKHHRFRRLMIAVVVASLVVRFGVQESQRCKFKSSKHASACLNFNVPSAQASAAAPGTNCLPHASYSTSHECVGSVTPTRNGGPHGGVSPLVLES